jgi:hypothetical protein
MLSVTSGATGATGKSPREAQPGAQGHVAVITSRETTAAGCHAARNGYLRSGQYCHMNVTLFEINVDDATFSPTSIIGEDRPAVELPDDPIEGSEADAPSSPSRRVVLAGLSAVTVVAGVAVGVLAARRFRARDAEPVLDEDHERIAVDAVDTSAAPER